MNSPVRTETFRSAGRRRFHIDQSRRSRLYNMAPRRRFFNLPSGEKCDFIPEAGAEWRPTRRLKLSKGDHAEVLQQNLYAHQDQDKTARKFCAGAVFCADDVACL